MRILYLTQYFPPEIGATQTRAFEMARHLTELGHQVTILTEVPNHPLGVIQPPFKGKLFKRSREHDIDVIRLWVYTHPKKTFLTRMLFYLSYMVSAIIAGLFLHRRDVVYASSPPLFVAAAGSILSLIRRKVFIVEIRDLWPESAVVLGELSNKRFIRWAEALEKRIYKHARKIVVVTRGIYQSCRDNGIPEEKLALIPNGANIDLYRPGQRDPHFLQQLGIDKEAFVVIYTGLMGLIHGLDFVFDSALALQNQGMSDIVFLFIGDGVHKERLIKLSAHYGLTNTRFIEAQPEEKLPLFIRCANVGLVTTKNIPLCRGTLPVKMFSYMACARPVCLCVQGEAGDIMEASDSGLVTEPENAQQLTRAVLFFYKHRNRAQEMGESGRRYVESHYSRADLALKLERVIQGCV